MYWHYCCSLLWLAIALVRNFYSLQSVGISTDCPLSSYLQLLTYNPHFYVKCGCLVYLRTKYPVPDCSDPSDIAIKRELNDVFLDPSCFCHTSYKNLLIFLITSRIYHIDIIGNRKLNVTCVGVISYGTKLTRSLVKMGKLFQNLSWGKARRHGDVTKLQLKYARNRKHMTNILASLRRRARW